MLGLRFRLGLGLGFGFRLGVRVIARIWVQVRDRVRVAFFLGGVFLSSSCTMFQPSRSPPSESQTRPSLSRDNLLGVVRAQNDMVLGAVLLLQLAKYIMELDAAILLQQAQHYILLGVVLLLQRAQQDIVLGVVLLLQRAQHNMVLGAALLQQLVQNGKGVCVFLFILHFYARFSLICVYLSLIRILNLSWFLFQREP